MRCRRFRTKQTQQTTDSIADSEVQIVTETENARDIIARQELDEHTPCVAADSDTTATTPDILKSPVMLGLKMLSAREADEMALNGDVTTWSSDSVRLIQ